MATWFPSFDEDDTAGSGGRWVWVAGRRWVDSGSTHPRDTDGDPA
jgi:hypothetical protein